MDQELKKLLEGQLAEEEILVWTGQPDPQRMAERVRGEFYFAVFWVFLMVIWRTIAFGTELPTKGEIFFSSLFYFVGFWLMSLPWSEKKKALGTIYGITDRRVLIHVPNRKKIVHSFSDPGKVTKKDLDGGRGDLTFSPQLAGPERDLSCDFQEPGFYGIPDVEEVEKIFRESLEKGEAKLEDVPSEEGISDKKKETEDKKDEEESK